MMFEIPDRLAAEAKNVLSAKGIPHIAANVLRQIVSYGEHNGITDPFELPEVLSGVIHVTPFDVFVNRVGSKLVDTGESVISVNPDGATTELRGEWEMGFEA